MILQNKVIISNEFSTEQGLESFELRINPDESDSTVDFIDHKGEYIGWMSLSEAERFLKHSLDAIYQAKAEGYK